MIKSSITYETKMCNLIKKILNGDLHYGMTINFEDDMDFTSALLDLAEQKMVYGIIVSGNTLKRYFEFDKMLFVTYKGLVFFEEHKNN